MRETPIAPCDAISSLVCRNSLSPGYIIMGVCLKVPRIPATVLPDEPAMAMSDRDVGDQSQSRVHIRM